jgi:hypothetical protein
MLKRERRARAQRGSVLSALLVIVAFLSILGGALMNEISSQFLITRSLQDRVATEATLNSSLESGIGKLETRPVVPAQCSTDPGVAVNPVSLNGQSASVISKPIFVDPQHLGYCQAIVPDSVTALQTGPSQADGTIGSRNTYLVGGAGSVYNYNFGQAGALWQVSVGGAITGPPAQSFDATRAGHLMTVVPNGNRVALIDDRGAGASLQCYMGAAAAVTSRPGFENAPSSGSPFFPNYVYFGDSSGKLSVFDATTNGGCAPIVSPADLGGPVVGGPLVLKGQQQVDSNQPCGGQPGDQDLNQVITTVDIFAVINRNGGGRLVHYQYCELTQGGQRIANGLSSVDSRSVSIGDAAGVAFSSTNPSRNIQLAVTSRSGYVALATIIVSGDNYSISTGPTKPFGGSFTHAPYWWHSAGGDRIGAGDQKSLLVLDTNLNVSLRYDGAVGITTTPSADSNGDWYFGADDGHVYDVERPAGGIQMFKAARFGPGGQVSSSPIVGGCSGHVCMYFGTDGNGAYLAQIGNGRVMDLTACSTSGSGSTTCIPGTQQLWARLEVGVANQSVNVIGWSYYKSP